MAGLSPVLTQIETKYDFDRTTPLFKHHKANMKYFEAEKQSNYVPQVASQTFKE